MKSGRMADGVREWFVKANLDIGVKIGRDKRRSKSDAQSNGFMARYSRGGGIA